MSAARRGLTNQPGAGSLRFLFIGGRRFAHTAVGGLMMLLLFGGCGSRNCASVGYHSGVGVQVPTRLWAVDEFCVDDRCLPGDAVLNGDGSIDVPDQPGEYTYRLRVVTPDGEEITSQGVVATQPYLGNGDGCDPLTANAVVKVHEDGAVTVEPP